MRASFVSLLAASSILALLAGCDMAPPYSPPDLAIPAHFKTAPLASAGPERLSENWWTAFRSAELNRLEALVEPNNPDLAAALGRYRRTQAVLELTNSSLAPMVSTSPQLSFNKQSQNRPLRSANQPTYYGANQIFGQASWEVDLWGRLTDGVAAAKASVESSSDVLDEIRLSLQASLARAYVALRGADAEAALLARTITIYRSALDLTEQRLRGNISPPVDVERSKVQLANAQAAAAEVARNRALLEDAVAALVGEPASNFKIGPSPARLATPRPPRSAPSTLLQRRPDVAAAERGLYAANERIGVAKADFFPRLTLLLSGGTQDTGVNLLNLHNSLWSLGPSVTAPIFDGGQHQANLDASRADYMTTAAQYRSTVLVAFQEVEDALASQRFLNQELSALSTSAQAAQRASDMSFSLYKDGAASSLEVVTAQSAALDAERAEIVVRTRLLQTHVNLMLALGGGWRGQAPVPVLAASGLALLGPQGQDPGSASQSSGGQEARR